MSNPSAPQVGIIMGSRSDWETLKHAADVLNELGIRAECRVVSAHRTPQWMVEYAQSAATRGIQVIVAGAGWSSSLARHGGIDDALACAGSAGAKQVAQRTGFIAIDRSVMPGGIPVGTLANWHSGSQECGLAGGAHLGTGGRRVIAAIPGLGSGANASRDGR